MTKAVRRWSCPVAVLCQALVLVACHHAANEVRRPTVRLTTGPPGGGFHRLGERLAAAYVKLLPDTNVEVHRSAGAVANVEAIQRGEAEVGFTFADVAYLAFEGQLKGTGGPFDRLRGIAVMQLTPVTLVVGHHAAVDSVRDLRGRRIGLGPPGSGTALTAGLLLQAFGLDTGDVQAELLPFGEAARRLTAGTLDAMFDNAVYPAESVFEATKAGARILPIAGPPVQNLRRDYPFLRLTFIPPDTYFGVSSAVHTIGVESLLVCRSDLDEALVYELTKRFFEVLPSLPSSPDVLGYIDLDQAPATPIPLHEGSARYYRERELVR